MKIVSMHSLDQPASRRRGSALPKKTADAHQPNAPQRRVKWIE
jgi:hypothetical protein